MESLYLKALSAFISLFEELEEKFGYKYMLVGGVLTSIMQKPDKHKMLIF